VTKKYPQSRKSDTRTNRVKTPTELLELINQNARISVD